MLTSSGRVHSHRRTATTALPTLPTPDRIRPAGNPGRLRLVIADHPDLVRHAIESLLVSDGGFDLVGTADSLDAAVRCARAYHPEVLVIDLLRLVEGRDVGGGLQPLRQEVPSVAIVILTDDRDPIMAREALSNGARAYTLKSARAHELYDAVHCAAKGETYLAPQLGGAVADLTMGRNGHALTARESEVLRLVALGYTNTEIASAQFLSVRTIETHRARLHAKLGTSTRAELVQVARKRGLLG